MRTSIILYFQRIELGHLFLGLKLKGSDIVFIKSVGCFYTWSNKHDGCQRFMSKSDRILGNDAWMSSFPNFVAYFHNEILFDHTPVVLVTSHCNTGRVKPFRYFNMWSMTEGFMERVKETWRMHVQGVPMFQIVTKLRSLKKFLKSLNKDGFGDIPKADAFAHHNL